MDSLNYQDIFFSKLKEIPFIFPLSCLEIKHRKLHALPFKECQHVFVKLLYINGFQAFIILFPEFIKRGMLPVHEIIVHCNRMRLQSVSRQLYRQPV